MDHLVPVRHVAESISSISEQRVQRALVLAMMRMVGIELQQGHGNGGQAEWREVRAASSAPRNGRTKSRRS